MRRPLAAHVLVVDDNAELAELLRQGLSGEGLSVRTAGNVAQALAAADERRPDLVIADLRLPDGTGADMLRELRLRAGEVPAIIITGWGDLTAASDACRAGCVDILTKPLDLARLFEAARREITRQRRMHRLRTRPARLQRLARRLECRRHDAQQRLDRTCSALTTAYRALSSQFGRQEALLTFQRELFACRSDDDVFRGLFCLFSTEREMLFGVAMLCDEEAELRIIGRFGTPAPDSMSVCQALAGSLVEIVLDSSRVLRLDMAEHAGLFPGWVAEFLPATTVLAVPLVPSPGRIIGMVVLYRKEGQTFSDDELALAELIGPSVAAAVKARPRSDAA